MNKNLVLEFEKLVFQISDLIKNKKSSTSDVYRLRTYRNALRIIKKYPKKIQKGEELEHITGIGKGIIDKINKILATGNIDTTEGNNDEYRLIVELMEIINIGEAKARELVEQYSIRSIEHLIQKCKKNEIKLNDKILLGLKYYKKVMKNIPKKEMQMYEKLITSKIKEIDKKYNVVICGSYRRGKSFSNDIDVLVTHPQFHIYQKHPKPFSQTNEKCYEIKKHGSLKSIVSSLSKFIPDDMALGPYKYMGFFKYSGYPVRRIDIRYVPYESYFTALVYFTGSMELNQNMRKIAKAKSMKLSEYGLYDKNGKMIKIKSEKMVFQKLSLPYLQPWER